MTEQHPELSMRASDADRERYGTVLREAFAEGRLGPDEYQERLDAVYRARTYGDLVPLVTDLPRVPGTPAPPVPAPVWTAAATGEPSAAVVAVFGSAERTGAWTVPPELTVTAVFGGATVDLRSAAFGAARVEIKAVAVMGGVDIVVPYGVHLEVEGVGIFGGFNHRPGPAAAPGAPVVRVTGVALFGGVDVTWAPHAPVAPLPPGAYLPELPPQPPPPLPGD